MTSQIKVTLKKSLIGSTQRQRANAQALGLKKINDTNTLDSKPEILGMVNKVRHLLDVEAI